MIAKISVASASAISNCPIGSSRRGCGARDSGITSRESTSAARQIGRLIRNTARHENATISAPPTSGPSAIEIPGTAPQAPRATARSWGLTNTLRITESAIGLSIEPPIAWSARAEISTPVVGATLQISEPRANTVSPIWNIRLRPIRSPVEAESISRPASTTV